MAKIRLSGFSEEIDALKRAGNDTGKLVRRMLKAGAETSEDIWRKVITERGHIDTGDMLRSVGTAWISEKTGAAEVYPLGKSVSPSRKKHADKRRKSVRNAEKAFILHYGRANLAEDPFVDEIERRIEDEAFDKMDEVFQQFINKEEI